MIKFKEFKWVKTNLHLNYVMKAYIEINSIDKIKTNYHIYMILAENKNEFNHYECYFNDDKLDTFLTLEMAQDYCWRHCKNIISLYIEHY